MQRSLTLRLSLLLVVGLLGGLGFAGSFVADGQDDPTPTPVPTETEACEYEWFFEQPEPEACPAGEVVVGEAAFQRFQYGYMVWTAVDDHIHVMHTTEGDPMWVRTPDPFVAGSPERDNAWPEPQPPQSEQPRNGFGAIWRAEDDLRARIGWAAQTWEFVYTANLQVGVDGTIYLSDPNERLFELLPGGEDWKLYR